MRHFRKVFEARLLALEILLAFYIRDLSLQADVKSFILDTKKEAPSSFERRKDIDINELVDALEFLRKNWDTQTIHLLDVVEFK